MSSPGATAPKVFDPATLALAWRIIRKGAGQLTMPEISFVRAMGAIATERSPTPEQAKRLEAIARRVGAEPSCALRFSVLIHPEV
jgi:hypothetical protein